MISGSIHPELIPKKILFLKGFIANYDRASCVCENGEKRSLVRDESGIRSLTGGDFTEATSAVSNEIISSLYLRKRWEFPILVGDKEVGKMFWEQRGRFLEIDGINEFMQEGVPEENINRLCRYSIRLNYSQVDFVCFNDKHFIPVLLGIYAIVLRVSLTSTTGSALV